MLANLKIATLLAWSLSGVVILNVAMVGVTHFKSSEVGDGAKFISETVYPTTAHANNIRMNVLRNWANTLLLGETSDPGEIEAITHEMTANSASITASFEFLNAAVADPADKQLLAETLAARKTYTDNRKQYVELVKSGMADEAKRYLVNTLRGNISEYVRLIGKLGDAQTDKMDRQIADMLAQFAGLKWTNLGLGLVVVLFSLTTAVFIVRGVLGKLGGEAFEVSDIASQIAAGNLKVKIPVKPGDAASVVASMASMRDKLRDIVGAIEQGSHRAALAAHRLAETADEVSKASYVQSEAANTTAAAVQQMTASISEVANSASSAREISRQTEQISSAGREVILRAASGMANIAAAVADSAAAIASLEQQSNEVTAIVNVIRGIADQTNLLALNAAIEAARAGEQGRGFAVVADEVRKLAERTSRSTLEIAQTIAKIQSGTQSAVTTMSAGVAQVDAGADLARQAGLSIDEIENSSANVALHIQQITAAIHEQNIACSEIARNVERIAQMTVDNSTAVHKTSDAARELEGISGALEKTIAYFHL
ncbi:methyl-accepting chemotaxis protein [Methylomonas sp. MED-D]|uniref:Uncharacterized protein n=1 Tax=Methylomonas koyamae TaxID=702114 RepID=A0A177N036_9GAMM|nr:MULTISPECIES: methyl-accepting chemotaxis protein [Methylomonas]NJA06210.1 methyl-accepting chemotaxis protein [Methylococcaceae bacterium WWC4]MDT4328591.1 methyl-accepting chemotaxis protein [Methylomonas sp. MV1]OAI11328.1 hypothetical protein A1355_16260 [Methylomonas koyamae]OHX34354.1 hypothetical protein BJL95_16910 [Methylomonas sp. LWB]WGS88173.1 methyl-accepting chemotaxis protein [Methylomonas sp. UP202]